MKPWWWMLVGCTAGDPSQTVPPTETDTDADTDSDTDTDTDTDVDTDTGPPTPLFPPFDTGPYGASIGVGQVLVRHDANTGRVVTAGVFVDDDEDRIDLAGCWPEPDVLCPTSLVDTWTTASPFLPRSRAFSGVGPSLLVGPWMAERRFDPVAGVHYRGESAGPWTPSTAVGITFSGGQWAPFVGADTLLVPPSISLLRPLPQQPVRLVDGEIYTVEWVPQPGQHEVTLEIRGAQEPGSTPLALRRRLPDTGTFDVDIDSLGLTAANRDVTFVLSRTRRTSFDVSGNPLDLALRTETRFSATHPPLGHRTAVAAVDSCDTAPLLEGEGRWYATLDFSANTFSENPCTGTVSRGRDAVFTVQVAPGERIHVDATRPGGDTSLALLADCTDASTCVASADVAPAGVDETLVYTNRTAAIQTFILLADAPSVSPAWVQTVDITRDRPTLDPFADSCADATLLPPTPAGRITVALAGAVDHLDPTVGACSLEPTDGPDVLLPLAIPAHTTVDVRAAGPVSLYLLQDCVDEGTCTAAAARFAPLRWHNATSEPIRQTLVVDQPAGSPHLGPVDLTLRYVTPVPSLAERCVDAGAPYATGLHLFDATLSSADHDLPSPSCTFDQAIGPDGVIPVRLEPGEVLTASLDHEGEGVLYVLESCGGAVLTCDDQPGLDEVVTYRNPGTTPQDVFLIADTWRPAGSGASSAAASIELLIE